MCALVRLTEDRLAYLEQQIIRRVPAPAVSEGWEYYCGKRVFGAEVVDGNTIYGAVNGSRVYAVMLDSDDFSFAACTCDADGGCKHMAAVFFHYAHLIGEDPGAIRLRAMRLPASSAAPPPGMPAADDGPEAWVRWFEADAGETWRACRHSLHPLQPVISRLKGTARDWPRPLQRLHWLHVYAFALEQAEKAYASTDAYNRYYYEMSFTRSADPWIAGFGELAGEIAAERLTPMEREWAASLSALLLSASLNAQHMLLRWDEMYRLLWERLAAGAEWRAAGRSELERLYAEAETQRQRTVLLGALAQLDVREGRDPAAIARLEGAEFDRIVRAAYGYAGLRLDQARYDDAALWLEFLYGKLRNSRNGNVLRPFLLLCRRADKGSPKERWVDMMVSLLPHSYGELSAHWLERGRYADWCDLQALLGMRPDELDAVDLREVARTAPAQLIPLYHLAIDESVGARNRQGYRAAAKLLKKLEKLYAAAGRSEAWLRYIGQFTQKYHRMRALQEELWRVKIGQ